MKGVITIFTLPQEFEDLAITLNALKRNSVFVDKTDIYKIDLLMCMSDELVDWNKSKLPKEYIESRTKELCETYLDWCEYSLNFEYGNEIIGCLSHRRKSIKENTDADFFIWLDTDIFFKDITLYYSTLAFKMIKEAGVDKFVVTPQFVKQWDDTWDSIVNQKYLNYPLNYQLDADLFQETLPQLNDVNINEIQVLKFAGGWFTLLSKELLNTIKLPESLGHYGPDDTFIMVCGTIMNSKEKSISQFIMENLLVGENYRYKKNKTIKEYIIGKNRKDEFRKIAEDNWNIEINKFISNLK
jgi:hypothetical protein